MDLYDITSRETYTYQVLHPVTKKPVQNTDGSPQWIELYGADTKHYRGALADVSRLSIDDPTEKLTAFLARITAAWSITAGGKQPDVKDATRIYPQFPSWLCDDLFAAASTRANFFAQPSEG